MANIIDYIHWRGDLTFFQSPFCEVDNLILSYFSYVNLDGIDEITDGRAASVKEVSRAFFELHTEQELKEDKSFIHLAPYAMQAMAGSKRFEEAMVKNYVNKIVAEEELQFSAVEIVLGDGTSYIAFRGTDDTIVGWKEDFNLSNGIVPAQKAAAAYLDEVGAASGRMLRVGGHSKGGNLSVYAASGCAQEVKERITEVYDNDGPGFSKAFLEEDGFKEISPRIIRIIPESSVIGMLLEPPVQPRIVASAKKGVFQHDGFSWQVMGPAFVSKQEMNKRAESFNNTLRKWIDGMDSAQRDALIDDLFSVLEATGAQTLTQVQDGGLKNVKIMLRQIEALNPKSREIVEELLKSLFSSAAQFLPFA